MGARLAGAVGSVGHPELHYAAFRMDTNFVFDFVCAADVINDVTTMNGGSVSGGGGGIPAKLVKNCINTLGLPLVYMVNLSFFTREFPSALKFPRLFLFTRARKRH